MPDQAIVPNEGHGSGARKLEGWVAKGFAVGLDAKPDAPIEDGSMKETARDARQRHSYDDGQNKNEQVGRLGHIFLHCHCLFLEASIANKARRI